MKEMLWFLNFNKEIACQKRANYYCGYFYCDF